MAFPSYSGPDGQVWFTNIDISYSSFGIVMATDMRNTYDLTPDSIGVSFYMFYHVKSI